MIAEVVPIRSAAPVLGGSTRSALEMPCFTCAKMGRHTLATVSGDAVDMLATFNRRLKEIGDANYFRVSQFAICDDCERVRVGELDRIAREGSDKTLAALQRVRAGGQNRADDAADRARLTRWGYGDLVISADEKRSATKGNGGNR